MANDIAIITTTPEARQIARVFHFKSDVAPHIEWNSIARSARELGAHFEVRTTDHGDVTITMFWAYEDHGPDCIGYGPAPDRRD